MQPLSPFLFLICAECFSSLIRTQVQCKKWQGIAMGRRAPIITHLLFVDDSLLFMQDSDDFVMGLLRTLQRYKLLSGQVVNL